MNWWTWLSRRYSENENYNDRGEEKRYPSPYQIEVSIMSRNILDELYDYDLFHLTEIEDMDGSYKAALDRLVQAEAELKKAFPDSADILDEYQTADIELHNLSNRNEFRKGFKVGAQLVLEMIKPIK